MKIRKENEEAKKFMVNKLGFQITTLKDAELLERLFRELYVASFQRKIHTLLVLHICHNRNNEIKNRAINKITKF